MMFFSLLGNVILVMIAWSFYDKWSSWEAYGRALWLRYKFIVDECGEAAEKADERWSKISTHKTEEKTK